MPQKPPASLPLSNDHTPRHKLDEETQIKLINDLHDHEQTDADLARAYGLTRPTINWYRKTYAVRPVDIFKAAGTPIARRWRDETIPNASRKGDHRPLERALIHGGHISDSDAKSVRVQVGMILSIPKMSGPIQLEAQHLVGEATPPHEDASAGTSLAIANPIPFSSLSSDDPTIAGG